MSRIYRAFPYFGSKFQTATRYPEPAHDTIVEPFAGAAGYSTRNHEKNVILFETKESVYGAWSFLIRSRAKDILRLPLLAPREEISRLNICTEAKDLIGFWCGAGTPDPKTYLTRPCVDYRPNGYWGLAVRDRLAKFAEKISHWQVHHKACDINPLATWFIDPPYSSMSQVYGPNEINYEELGRWCKARKGQKIVCEIKGADWLPFKPLFINRTSKTVTTEVAWLKP